MRKFYPPQEQKNTTPTARIVAAQRARILATVILESYIAVLVAAL